MAVERVSLRRGAFMGLGDCGEAIEGTVGWGLMNRCWVRSQQVLSDLGSEKLGLLLKQMKYELAVSHRTPILPFLENTLP